jgi:hypothetical protein
MARILLVALTVATLAAGPSTAVAATGILQVVVVGGGTVSIAPAPLAETGDGCGDPIEPKRDTMQSCLLTYDVGTPVTAAATGFAENLDAGGGDTEGPPTTLSHWSDEHCPGTGPCALVVGPDTTALVATFTPQRVSVQEAGTGTFTSAPSPVDPPGSFRDEGGGACTEDSATCYGDFPLGADVTLAPDGPASWLSNTPERTFCDAVDAEDPPRCHMTMTWPRWAAVGFGGAQIFEPPIPPDVSVAFQVRKAGSGSGTVRSEAIDCGGSCTRDLTFGVRQTLVASPHPGSRFDHWGTACGAAPTCRLAVGPVTGLTAFFERGSGAGGVAQQQQQSKNPRLTARLLRINVRGHGRKRTVLIRLRLNAASTVRAVLLRGRRQVAAKRFRVAAGTHLLRFRVPVRARPGSYRVRLTIKGNGQTKRLTQRVRLRR